MARDADKAVPPARMPRDEGGWQVAPAPDGRGMPEEPKPPPPHRRRWFWIVFLVLLAINWLSLLMAQTSGEPRVKVPFSPYFLGHVQAGEVKSISSRSDTIEGTFKTKLRYPPGDAHATPTTLFATQVPAFWDHAALTALLQSEHVEVNAKNPNPGTSLLATILLGFGPTILLIGLFWLFARRAQSAGGGLGGLGNFGRSRARRADPEKIRVTFADVAGIEDAKGELTEIVDFLRTPDRYARLGGRLPHGVLLFGPPGTGKTLLARAIAGEAHAAFFSIAASEFIEAIVGVGAARVRDLFAKAKEAAPSIIFIDELDAIGRSRQGSAGITGANDEREQTLDQILTEMDGFEINQAVVVLGATNRPEILDPALLRPGRFDRRVAVQPPDRDGTAHDPQGPHPLDAVGRRRGSERAGIDDAGDGRRRPGQPRQRGGAAGSAAAHEKVRMTDFTDALEKILLGAPRGIDPEPARTASGPPTTSRATRWSGCSPRRPTRYARCRSSRAGRRSGSPSPRPDSDRVSYSREELEAKIKVSLGGRVAEEIVYGKITTGAESDLQQLTQIARQMVGRWGMSDRLGPDHLPAQRRAGAVAPRSGRNLAPNPVADRRGSAAHRRQRP